MVLTSGVHVQTAANVGSGGAGVGGPAVQTNIGHSDGNQGGATGGIGGGGDGVTNVVPGRRL